MATKGTHGAVTLPTGEQIPQSVMQEIKYNNATGSFVEGDIVSFNTSTWTGTIIQVIETTGTSGELHVRVEEPVPSPFLAMTLAEDIIVNAVKIAEVANLTGGLYYFQQVVVVGKNMINKQEIDEHGSAHVTFAEGAPQFDAFGKLQTSTQHKIAEYIMSYDELPNDFTTEIVDSGGTSLTYNHDTRGVKLTCGITAGDKVVRTSDEYHVYQAGYSQLIEFTGSMGDAGKANVIRRGGYYDDENGVYFEFKENQLGVGLRSKATGSIVETFVPSTEWNKDTLDGQGGVTNPSGVLGNPLIDTIYWIDLQWLGAGIVRYGIVHEGNRIVAHEIHNVSNHSYMSTGSLPFRYEQENIGTAASASEFNIYCATVKTEGTFNPFVRAFVDYNTASVATVNETPILGYRAAETYKTFNNRGTGYPSSFSIHNSADGPIMFHLRRGCTAAAGAWVSHGGESVMELNKTMTGVSGGKIRFSSIIGAGETKDIPFPAFEKNRRGIRRKADITQWVELMFSAQLLVAGTGGLVTVVFNWDEVRD